MSERVTPGRFYDYRQYERRVEVVRRCQAREDAFRPVVWEVRNVDTGRSTYVSDKVLRKDYWPVTAP